MKSGMAVLGSAHELHPSAAPAPRASARLAGLLYLVVAVAAGVAHFYVPGQLIVPGDAARTASNIQAHELLFRAGIASEYVVLLSEVALSILLYILLKPAGATLALIAAAFRLVMTAIHGLNLLNAFMVLRLLASPDLRASFGGAQLPALVRLFLDAHHDGFAIGIVFLIPHVFILGYLIVVSGYIPRLLGVLFLLAGCGYLIDSAAQLVVPGYGATPALLALPIAVAEIAFPLWLLFGGVKNARP